MPHQSFEFDPADLQASPDRPTAALVFADFAPDVDVTTYVQDKFSALYQAQSEDALPRAALPAGVDLDAASQSSLTPEEREELIEWLSDLSVMQMAAIVERLEQHWGVSMGALLAPADGETFDPAADQWSVLNADFKGGKKGSLVLQRRSNKAAMYMILCDLVLNGNRVEFGRE